MSKLLTDNTIDERLDGLLAAADPVANVDLQCGSSDDLVRRLSSLRSHRRSRRRVLGGGVAIATAAVVSFVLVSINKQSTPIQMATPNIESPQPAQTASAGPVAVNDAISAKTELARLRGDIRQLRRAIKQPGRQAKYRSRLAAMRRRVARPDPLVTAQRQIEKTAYILVARAAHEEVVAQAGNDPSAIYKKAIELFPGTTWAKVAQNRLDNPLKKTDPLPGSNPKGQL